MSRGPWNKCERSLILSRLCRESLFTSWKPATLDAGVGDGGFHPQPLPHGECGAWGSAPRFGCSLEQLGSLEEPGGKPITRTHFFWVRGAREWLQRNQPGGFYRPTNGTMEAQDWRNCVDDPDSFSPGSIQEEYQAVRRRGMTLAPPRMASRWSPHHCIMRWRSTMYFARL